MQRALLLAVALGVSGCATPRRAPPPCAACPPAPGAPTRPPVAARGTTPRPATPSPGASAPPAQAAHAAPPPAVVPVPARSFRETVADLVREARAGGDPAVAGYAELLEMVAACPEPGERTEVVRDRAREDALVASHGRGSALASVATFFQPGADAAALRRVFLDLDRTEELTGKPGTRLVSRDGPVLVGETDATRKVLLLTFSARWRFEVRELDRGSARLFTSRMLPWDGTANVLESRALFLAVPEPGGVRAAYASLSAVDFEVPPIARGAAAKMAEREIRDRVDGLRSHWGDYVRNGSRDVR